MRVIEVVSGVGVLGVVGVVGGVRLVRVVRGGARVMALHWVWNRRAYFLEKANVVRLSACGPPF